MKFCVIIAVGALVLGSCTGPGLEPPFSGDEASAEPNDATRNTSQGGPFGTSDAGSSWDEPDSEAETDAGSEDD